MAEAYLFKTEHRDEPAKPVGPDEMRQALRNRLHVGRGPWRLRELREGDPVGDWGPFKLRASFIRSVIGHLRRAKVGTVVQIESRQGKRFRVRAIKLPESVVDRVQTIALGLRGVPYVFGGSDPEKGLDCSGFTAYVLEAATDGRVVLPHAARLQQTDGQVHSLPRSRALPWDLLFMWFPNDRGIPQGVASHVGFFVTQSLMFDTRSPSDPVSYSAIEAGNVIEAGRIEAVNG